MRRRTRIPRRPALLIGALALVAAFPFLGVVMGETHVPVAVEPDAEIQGGLQVATFALG